MKNKRLARAMKEGATASLVGMGIVGWLIGVAFLASEIMDEIIHACGGGMVGSVIASIVMFMLMGGLLFAFVAIGTYHNIGEEETKNNKGG